MKDAKIHKPSRAGILLLSVFLFGCVIVSRAQIKPLPPVSMGSDGILIYSADSLGNRVPDFSWCGYQCSETPIPQVPVKIVVPVPLGDATSAIRKAIDYVANLPVDGNGFRGAILLQPGVYNVRGRFTLKTSGIVIRGSGWENNGTVLIADGLDRETLFRIEGEPDEYGSDSLNITREYIPVNTFQITVDHTEGLKPGSIVRITRPATQAWIDYIGMREFGGETAWLGWRPGFDNMHWVRKIVAIDVETLTLDIPLTMSLDGKFGGGYAKRCTKENRLSNVGIENLWLKSSFNEENSKDENHCWNAISFEHVENGWVRQVRFQHFAGSAVAAYETASKITVEDCISTDPVSEIAACRRNTFFNAGSMNLFQRLYAKDGYHDFATGFMATGPNAFVQCQSELPYNFSGAIDSWASGVLFDNVNVDGHKLSFANRGQDAQGAGWTAAYSMFWQCSAARIENFAPPGAVNWAFGAWGQFAGNGYWNETNSHVNPRSLFYAQLGERIGKEKLPQNTVIEYSTNATTSPTIEQAAEIVAFFQTPVKTVKEWIEEEAPVRSPIPVEVPGEAIYSSDLLSPEKEPPTMPRFQTQVKNGWLVHGKKVITGETRGVPWWNMNVRPRGISRSEPALTRYVPGRIGKGYTDDLKEVLSEMDEKNIAVIEQHYALWYDRRRDDHERIRRMDADVWAPFYEVPFSRSGKELAWDGLSKYDLTSYNPWYWSRLKEFAGLADQNGKILFHQHFFQHHILEAGAHWVDSPWRTVNNINDTGFPEPPPFAGDKRIFIADRFYDVSHPVRRELYKQYIRKCLGHLKENTAVIHATSEEYTGPFPFVAFWLDVIAEWEHENQTNVLVALSATKDVQDSILSDPIRSRLVDIIDIRYWSSRPDGSVYAPRGGLSLAPRQFARLENPGKRSFEQVYHDVFSYRNRYPEKAVIYSENRSPSLAWAIFMASGSLASIPKIEVAGFLESASTMNLVPVEREGTFQLKNESGEAIYYCGQMMDIQINFNFTQKLNVEYIDPETGHLLGKEKMTDSGTIRVSKAPVVVWIHK